MDISILPNLKLTNVITACLVNRTETWKVISILEKSHKQHNLTCFLINVYYLCKISTVFGSVKKVRYIYLSIFYNLFQYDTG